jgi:hypothetical protein
VNDHVVSPMDVPTANESTVQSIHHSSHLTQLTMSELTLPTFERNSKQNALFRMSQLDNYFPVKFMSKSLQLFFTCCVLLCHVHSAFLHPSAQQLKKYTNIDYLH